MNLLLRMVLLTPLVFAYVGCAKPQPKGTPPVAVAPSPVKSGWEEIRSAGFSISVPKDWTPLDLSSGDLEKLLNSASAANPGIKSSEAMIRAAAAQGAIKLMAFAPPVEEFTPNVNVVVLDQPITPTLDQLKAAYESEMKGMLAAGTVPDGKSVTLPAGPAYRMESRLPMAGKEILSIAYLLGKNKKSYTITFSGQPKDREAFSSLSSEIIETLRID